MFFFYDEQLLRVQKILIEVVGNIGNIIKCLSTSQTQDQGWTNVQRLIWEFWIVQFVFKIGPTCLVCKNDSCPSLSVLLDFLVICCIFCAFVSLLIYLVSFLFICCNRVFAAFGRWTLVHVGPNKVRGLLCRNSRESVTHLFSESGFWAAL